MATNVYKINGSGLRIPLVSADPSSPENGMIWYNTTDNIFRKYENGAISDVSSGSAATVSYNNFTSGLSATNVQDAIDEIVSDGATNSANKSLSNLTTTAINADLLSAADSTKAIGSVTNSWTSIYSNKVLAADTVFLGGLNGGELHSQVTGPTDFGSIQAYWFGDASTSAFTVSSAFSTGPRPSPESLTADDQVVDVQKSSYVHMGSDDPTASNRTFTLTSGVDLGQLLTLDWNDATNRGELLNTGNVRLADNWRPTAIGDNLALKWTGTLWIEQSRFPALASPESDPFSIHLNGDNSPSSDISWNSHKITSLSAGTTAGDSVRYEQAILISGVNAFAANQPMGGFKLTGLGDPTAAQDAVTKNFVDGLPWKHTVRAAAATDGTTNVPLTGGATLTIDSVSIANGDRVLLTAQTTTTQNGIYDVSGIGSAYTLTRSQDADSSTDFLGLYVVATEGALFAFSAFFCTATEAFVLGSSTPTIIRELIFSQSSAGSGITVSAAGVIAVDTTVVRTNGANAFTANQPMGTHKLTGLSAGTTAGDSVRYEQAILASGANAFAANQSMGGNKLTNLADPTTGTDAVNVNYLSARLAGLKPKQSVRVSSTANIDLSVATDPSPVDGITLADGDRILLKAQAAPAENGIYDTVTAADPTTWTRSTDFDSLSPIDEINGAWVAVQEGTVSAGKVYVQYGLVSTIGVSAINFEYFNPIASLIGGDMITFTGSVFSVDLASASGLESTNPGNNAGQLRIKLEATNPTLKFTGSNELAAKLSASGAIVTGASGLAVNPDGTTLDISANALEVKDGGITNVKVASGIDAVKIGAGTVTNTVFGYIASLTSDAQSQINGKLSTVSQDTTPSLGGNLTIGDNVLIGGSHGIRQGSSSSLYFEEQYNEDTLTASQTSTVLTSFTFAHATYEALSIDYAIRESSTNRLRVGTLYVVSNGTNTSFVDTLTETADVGVTWDLNISGGNTQVRYTTTANDKAMKSVIKRLKA